MRPGFAGAIRNLACLTKVKAEAHARKYGFDQCIQVHCCPRSAASGQKKHR
jgi:hypothetical protein